MGCFQSSLKEGGGSSAAEGGAVSVFVPGLRSPSRTTEVAKALSGLVSTKPAELLIALRTRIEAIASGESGNARLLSSKRKGATAQQSSHLHALWGGSAIAELQGALEDYLPVLLGLVNEEKLSQAVEFCWINQEEPRQETRAVDTCYELLSVLHLMATLRMSQANLLLVPKPPVDGYQPKTTEENRRAAIDAFLKAAGILKHVTGTLMLRMSEDLVKKLPADLTQGALHALCMQILGQGIEIQLSFALDNPKATLAVKRRLACEQLKCWTQVKESLGTVQFGNGWSSKHHHFVNWKFAEAKAGAYYFHGLILDEGSDDTRHAKAAICLQLAESCLMESKKFCADFCASTPVTRIAPLWGAMKYLSERIPKDAATKGSGHKKGDTTNVQKTSHKVPDLPDFTVALQPEAYNLPELDAAWSAEVHDRMLDKQF